MTPEQLVLEITETELLDDAAERRPLRRAARARHPDRARRLRHGLLVAELPALAAAGHPQDRQAVRRRADGGGRDASFIGVIVDLARKLGLDVIAEGIETPAQLDALRDLGVEFGQGLPRPPERRGAEAGPALAPVLRSSSWRRRSAARSRPSGRATRSRPTGSEMATYLSVISAVIGTSRKKPTR